MARDAGAELQRLVGIGIALSREHDLQALLELIAGAAREITGAEGASLYLREGEELRFAVCRNDVLEERLGPGAAAAPFLDQRLPVNRDSVAGTVALSGQPLNLDDVYDLPADLTCTVSHDFDRQTGYRTRSMLAVPLKDPAGEVLGVLQLINARGADGAPGPFPAALVELAEALGSQAAVAVANARFAQALKESHLSSITRLAAAAEFRDKETSHHIQRISRYSTMIARAMELPGPQVELIQYASPMHDIGKLGVPDAILLKPGRLTDDERAIMEGHTRIGAEILKDPDSEILRAAREIALYHHERWNGAGYPEKLKGEAIPLLARIVGLVDVFDAVSCRRVYKPAFPPEVVREIMKQEREKHFDPAVFDAFEGISPEIEALHRQIGEV